jgi:hypothetical protein
MWFSVLPMVQGAQCGCLLVSGALPMASLADQPHEPQLVYACAFRALNVTQQLHPFALWCLFLLCRGRGGVSFLFGCLAWRCIQVPRSLNQLPEHMGVGALPMACGRFLCSSSLFLNLRQYRRPACGGSTTDRRLAHGP